MHVEGQRRSLCHGVGLVLVILLSACSPSTLGHDPSIAIPTAGAPQPPVEEGSLRRVMMTRHNEERARWGLAPLTWDDELVAHAHAYSRQLASRSELVHDPSVRGVEGENLWRGTRDSFTYDQMIGAMIEERRLFRPGLFPDVSTSGNWRDVAHYTQMIWPTTTRLGCAVTRGIFYDYLVCRYGPPGNVTGRPVGMRLAEDEIGSS